jgi:hypothetical protein
MENRKLKDIHDAALEYAEARDARITATTPEVETKQRLLDLMKKHKLEHYKFDNVTIDLVHEKEGVKVRVTAAEIEKDVPVNGKAKAARKSA